MRSLSIETHLCGDIRQPALIVGLTPVPGMPYQGDVDILESSGAKHVDLASAAFFSRRAIETDGPAELVRSKVVLHRDGGQRRRRSKQVVTTAVAITPRHNRIPLGDCLLREARERVIFAQDRDDRLALSPFCDERCLQAGDLLLNTKSLRREFFAEDRCAAHLLKLHLGSLPNLAGQVAIALGLPVHFLEDFRAVPGRCLGQNRPGARY